MSSATKSLILQSKLELASELLSFQVTIRWPGLTPPLPSLAFLPKDSDASSSNRSLLKPFVDLFSFNFFSFFFFLKKCHLSTPPPPFFFVNSEVLSLVCWVFDQPRASSNFLTLYLSFFFVVSFFLSFFLSYLVEPYDTN